MKNYFASVSVIIEAIACGEMVVVCDDEDRENEGDLMMAAELVTPEDINFMATYARGLVCLPMSPEMLNDLKIPDMVRHNNDRMGTAFTVPIDAATGITSGVSAADRARTIRVAVNSSSTLEDLVMPGHVFPLRARLGGVLERAGHTEAAVHLARIAGLRPAGVICEIMNADGTMARAVGLRRFAAQHRLMMVTVTQLIDYAMWSGGSKAKSTAVAGSERSQRS